MEFLFERKKIVVHKKKEAGDFSDSFEKFKLTVSL